METKKLERIIIIILALLNVFLLIVVLTDSRQDRNSRRETAASLTALLEAGGVEVGSDVELLQDCPPRCTVARDMELEQRRVQGLLGNHSSEDQGGSIWFYSSERGQSVMRGTGEMDLLLSGSSAARERTKEKTAEALMARAGMELYNVKGDQGEAATLELCCRWNGIPVYNAALTFDFSGERLYMVSGTTVFNVETGSEDGVGMDSVSVLVRFLDLTKSAGFICSRLDALLPGYYMNVTMSGESTLTPVWRFVTDTGDIYVDAVTGRVENLL